MRFVTSKRIVGDFPITCEQCKTTEVDGRRITFSHGLNDNRGKVLSGNGDVQRRIQLHAAGKDTLHVLVCQDSTHPDARQDDDYFAGIMVRFLRKFLPRHLCAIRVEKFAFEETSISNADRQRGLTQCVSAGLRRYDSENDELEEEDETCKNDFWS